MLLIMSGEKPKKIVDESSKWFTCPIAVLGERCVASKKGLRGRLVVKKISNKFHRGALTILILFLGDFCRHGSKQGFMLEHGLVGFPQFEKNMPRNIYVTASNGTQKKIYTRISTIFLKKIKYSKTSLTKTLI